MTASLEQLETRAAAAEQRLAAVESKLAEGAGPASAGAGGGSKEAFRKELQQLRAVLLAAKEENAKLAQEREQALKRASKLEYQCEHLKRALREADEKYGHPGAEKS